ncbi:alpha/beta hydrolase [candidate division KSB1 bacterium]|nr:alpha/beta hydrolase [candidate division KSB1 bacterium]
MNAKLSIFLLLLLTSCSLDANLFNAKETSAYKLPGNTIPDSLIEAVTFSSQGNKLYGFWVRSSGAHPDVTILYCHGNKYNIDEYWDRVMDLHQLGTNILIYDYRGYGKSEATSSESGLYADARAALQYTLGRTIAADSLVIYGYSLGNVASIYLAATQTTPYTLIAEAPFASANSLTQGSTVLDIPALWLTDGSFDNASKIKNIKCPFLLLHGEADEFVRFRDNGKVIFENAPDPKKLVLIKDANHTDIPETMGVNTYLETLKAWIW